MAVALPTAIVNIIQQQLLDREFKDALFPQQMMRKLASKREKWEANVGETQIFTRDGLLPVNTKRRTPGVDPTPLNPVGIEQWIVTAGTWNDSLDTHMPTSNVSIDNLFLRNAKKLALQAGQTLNHIVRNRLYNAYLGGNSYVTATAAAGTSIAVAHLAGFREVMVGGRPTAVSASNKLKVTIKGVVNYVTGVTPTDATNPDGPGVIIVENAVAVTEGDAVLADNRSRVIRVGGATTSNGIAASNKLTMAAIRKAVTQLRKNNVPPHADGFYHCHLDPDSEAQLFEDSEFQLLFRGSQITTDEYRELIIAELQGVRFYRDNEVPQASNTSDDDYVAGDMLVQVGANAGVEIHRPIITGDGAIMEKYIDEMAYLTSVGANGKVGSFYVDDGGLTGDMEGIRYIIRKPQDRLQNVVAQTWSFSGDWGVPSDSLTGTPDLFKRAVVLEHGA